MACRNLTFGRAKPYLWEGETIPFAKQLAHRRLWVSILDCGGEANCGSKDAARLSGGLLLDGVLVACGCLWWLFR